MPGAPPLFFDHLIRAGYRETLSRRIAGYAKEQYGVLETADARRRNQRRRHRAPHRPPGFAIWGLSFKPNTDDLREAPSLVITRELAKRGAALRVTDPVVTRKIAGSRIPESAVFCPGPYEAAEGADAVFVITEWNDFRHPDMHRLEAAMRGRVIFDGRNLFTPARIRRYGFEYFGVGRGTK